MTARQQLAEARKAGFDAGKRGDSFTTNPHAQVRAPFTQANEDRRQAWDAGWRRGLSQHNRTVTEF